MFRVVVALLVLSIASCASKGSSNTVVLNYEHFGPPAMANEVIGMDWWQWQQHGDSRPGRYDIKVVVYKGADIEKVKSVYPVEPDRKKDYRYLEYGRALQYLEKNIEKNVIDSVTERLVNTKKLLVKKMASPE